MLVNLMQYRKLKNSFKLITVTLLIFAVSSLASAVEAIKTSTPEVLPEAIKVKNIIMIGDSLTAGYGLPLQDGITQQLEDALNKHYNGTIIIKVKNAGVSGDTSSGGLSRFNWVLSGKKPDLVIIEFGANDMMRGIDPKITLSNMDKMLKILSDKKINTIIAGMAAFPNLGDEYENQFNRIYPSLAKKYKMKLYPFFLKNVAAVAKLNQADSIHPNKKGIAVITKNILPVVIESLSN